MLLDLTDWEDDAEAEEEDSEAERRIALASYYRQLVRGGLFDDDSEEAKIVDREVRQFARARQNALLGLRELPANAPESVFTDAQIAALKQLADRALERQEIRTPEPVIRKMEAPVVQAKPVPAIKKPKPQVGIKRRKDSAVPAAPSVQSNPPPQPPKVEAPPALDYDALPIGEVFEENGRKFKIILSPRIGDDGEPKRVKMDVTEPVRNPQAVPFPRREHMNIVTAQHAQSVVDANIGSSEVAMRAAAHSMKD